LKIEYDKEADALYILTLPSPPTMGERIKVRGSNVMAIFVPLFT
jgi:uncharacterized protein YuzE